MVKQVADTKEFQELINGDKPVVVDFTATWCGPCQFIGPKFVALAEETGDKAIFIKVDVDEASDIAQECGISCMPTFKIYKNGAVVDELQGASEEKLKAIVAKAIA